MFSSKCVFQNESIEYKQSRNVGESTCLAKQNLRCCSRMIFSLHAKQSPNQGSLWLALSLVQSSTSILKVSLRVCQKQDRFKVPTSSQAILLFILYVFFFLKVICYIARFLSEKCALVKVFPKRSMVCPVLWPASNSYFEGIFFLFSEVNRF